VCRHELEVEPVRYSNVHDYSGPRNCDRHCGRGKDHSMTNPVEQEYTSIADEQKRNYIPWWLRLVSDPID
jgi:hypothetical protein